MCNDKKLTVSLLKAKYKSTRGYFVCTSTDYIVNVHMYKEHINRVENLFKHDGYQTVIDKLNGHIRYICQNNINE